MKKYQVKITLKGVKPAIWRRVEVSPNILLGDFHTVIQDSMGWMDSHLHEFRIGRDVLQPRHQIEDDEFSDECIDYTKIKLEAILKQEGDKVCYIYDFGDSWEHSVVLEKILDIKNAPKHPVCTAGKRICPPEDCGGTSGYMQILEILKDPTHEEHEETLEWLMIDNEEHLKEYFRDNFDIEFVNKLLSGEITHEDMFDIISEVFTKNEDNTIN